MMILAKRHSLYRGGLARDFAGLMELYEANYIRLRRLLPDLQGMGDAAVSTVSGGLDLHLRVVERSRYTTTLNLTYHFVDAHGMFPAPDVTVRIYHDAQMAEVLSCGRRRGHRSTDYDRTHNRYGLDRKWQINRFLQKWLGYCLRQGHGFGGGQAATAPVPEDLGALLRRLHW